MRSPRNCLLRAILQNNGTQTKEKSLHVFLLCGVDCWRGVEQSSSWSNVSSDFSSVVVNHRSRLDPVHGPRSRFRDGNSRWIDVSSEILLLIATGQPRRPQVNTTQSRTDNRFQVYSRHEDFFRTKIALKITHHETTDVVKVEVSINKWDGGHLCFHAHVTLHFNAHAVH